MARFTYGPVIVAEPTGVGAGIEFDADPIPVSRTLGGANELDLVTFAKGTANGDGTVTPDATTGAAGVEGPDGYSGVLWFAGYPVFPNELVDEVAATWSTISGKPAVVAAGATQADAQAAIGLGPSNVWMMPVWDGTGTEPTRPTLPDGFFTIWRQPTAPTHGVTGDEWEGIAGA